MRSLRSLWLALCGDPAAETQRGHDGPRAYRAFSCLFVAIESALACATAVGDDAIRGFPRGVFPLQCHAVNNEEQQPSQNRWGASHLWLLLSYPRRPRLFTALILCTGVQLLARVACQAFDPLPHHAQFQPVFFLGALAAVLAGPAGVWSAPLASLLADLLIDWNSGAWFRAGGALAAALHVFVCWDSSFRRRVPALHMPPTWAAASRFSVLATLGGLVSAAWSGLGAELSGMYAFGHVAAIEGLQAVVFGVIAAPVLYRAAARDIAGQIGDWRMALGQKDRWAHWRPAGLLVLNLVACAAVPAGVLYGLQVAGDWPWAGSVPGLTTGYGLPEAATGLLALHLLAAIWPD